MKRTSLLSSAFLVLASVGLLGSASAAPAEAKRGRRVVVAGPATDAMATRVQQELGALGFDAVRVGALDGCARRAVVVAALEEKAVAATCSDGEQVGISIVDGSSLRLKDVVVAREEGDRARETTALRAAEITRASLALQTGDGDPPRPASTPPAGDLKPDVNPPGGNLEELDKPPKAPPRPKAPRVPRFLASVGIGALLGIDASAATLASQVEVGVLRFMTATARLDFPLEKHPIRQFGRGDELRIAPAFAGAGVAFPLLPTSSLLIPRLGVGGGVAWIRAIVPARAGFDEFGNFQPTSGEGSDSVAAPAMYGTAGLSLRVFGPARLTVDGLFGTTFSRMVARSEGRDVAYWGQPFASVALRTEMMF